MHVSYVSISAAHFLKTTSATLDWAGIILLQLLLLQVEAILQRTYVRTRTAENSCQWPIKYNYAGTTLEEDRTLLAFFSRAAHRLLSQIYHS